MRAGAGIGRVCPARVVCVASLGWTLFSLSRRFPVSNSSDRGKTERGEHSSTPQAGAASHDSHEREGQTYARTTCTLLTLPPSISDSLHDAPRPPTGVKPPSPTRTLPRRPTCPAPIAGPAHFARRDLCCRHSGALSRAGTLGTGCTALLTTPSSSSLALQRPRLPLVCFSSTRATPPPPYSPPPTPQRRCTSLPTPPWQDCHRPCPTSPSPTPPLCPFRRRPIQRARHALDTP